MFLETWTRPASLLPYLLTFAVSASVSTLVVATLGPQTGGDSARYTTAAERIRAGDLPRDNKASSYLGFAAALAAVMAVTGRAESIVVLNIVALALAACAVFELGRRLFGRRGGVVAAGLLVMNVEIATWSAFVLTDAMYLSCVAMATLAIHIAAERRGPVFVPALLIVVFTASIRPNGWLMLPVALVYWLGRAAGGGLVILLVVGALLSPAVREGVQAEHLDTALVDGRVISGTDAWRVPMPPPDGPLSDGVDVLRFVLVHPLASLRLAVTRIGAELLHARPNYSWDHNLIAVGFYLPMYVFAVMGFARVHREPLARLVSLVIVAHLGLVGVTFGDWDGRFLLHVVPLIGTLAAGGLAGLFWGGRHLTQPGPVIPSPT